MSEIYRPQKCYQQLLIMKYQRWQREVDRSRARHRGRAEEPADEPPTKERLKLHDELQKAESSLLVQMRTGKIGLRAFLFERRTPGAGCNDSSLFVWRWPGDSAACGSILPPGGDNQTGVAVRDAHAPRFRYGGKGPYQGSQPNSVAHAEAASGWI